MNKDVQGDQSAGSKTAFSSSQLRLQMPSCAGLLSSLSSNSTPSEQSNRQSFLSSSGPMERSASQTTETPIFSFGPEGIFSFFQSQSTTPRMQHVQASPSVFNTSDGWFLSPETLPSGPAALPSLDASHKSTAGIVVKEANSACAEVPSSRSLHVTKCISVSISGAPNDAPKMYELLEQAGLQPKRLVVGQTHNEVVTFGQDPRQLLNRRSIATFQAQFLVKDMVEASNIVNTLNTMQVTLNSDAPYVLQARIVSIDRL